MNRVVGIGDAHLGRQAFSKTTPAGVNQREADFEAAFEDAVELALGLEPDLVVWLGDVFDHARPAYRAYRVAQRALARVRDHGVPLVAIAGNHDMPRLRGSASAYAALADAFPGFAFAHAGAYECFDFPGVRVHAVPQTATVEEALSALETAAANRSLDRTNLLLAHPRIREVEPRPRDLNEVTLDAAALSSDLVLLGHYHVPTRVREGAWFAGSTDTFSFKDQPNRHKGVLLVDCDEGRFTHHATSGRRPLIDLEPIAAAGLSPSELEETLLERVAEIPSGAVARLFVDGAEVQAYRLVDHRAVAAAAGGALALRIEPTFLDTASRLAELPNREAIGDRWSSYLENQDLTGYDGTQLCRDGADLLAAAIDEAG
ncbi:MAG: metallophosphoesterase family protein [Acidimicrobiia bacterium]